MRMPPLPDCTPARQRGAALLIILAIIGIGVAFLLVSALNKANRQIERDKITSASLAQAKEALIGFAATYRDTPAHATEVFGFLPCPDTNNDGLAEPICGATDVSAIGRLQWKTLGLPALRDSGGECLWLAVSGSGKDIPKTAAFNWDTTGQLIVLDAGGTTLAGATPHERPLALILAPRTAIGSQTRTSAGASECGGSNTATDYLESAAISAAIGGTSTITLSTASSVASGTNNDQGLWITSRDIFDRVKKRSDFKTDIDSMLGDLSYCLNNLTPAGLPPASPGNKGIDSAITACPAMGLQKINVLTNWKDNLLYTKPATAATVNGTAGCNAVLFFGGERTTRTVAPLTAQTRVTAAEKGDATNYGDPAMYLEGTNATLFPASGDYTGAVGFSSTNTSADIVRCIKGLPAGAAQKSFATDLASFVPAGVGVTTDATNKTITVANAGGASGGCFWFPNTVPLAGKTLRAYYDFKFNNADPIGGTDNGNGFTFSLLRSDVGAPASCGTQANMGAFTSSDLFGFISLLVENDVYRDIANNDPVGNHTAIMYSGNLAHSAVAGGNGYTSSACDGTAQGCLFSPADKYEESPAPLTHNQRIEIHTGCNSSCSSCDQANHVAPNTYAKISSWVDCTDCNDVVVDFLGTELISATANRDFSVPGNWTGTNWSVASGVFSHTAGPNSATLPNSALASPPVAGSTYQVVITIVTTTPGTLTISFGGTSTASINPAPGIPTTYTVRLTATSAGILTLTPDATWAGTIDNVSVSPVKTPTINRCISLDTEMNSIYFGFTGGFLSGTAAQGVTLSNFYLRSE